MRDAPPAVGARGRLVTYTVIRKPPAAFADEPIYAVAVVDLEDGRRLAGRLERFEPPPALGTALRLREWRGEVALFALA